LDISCCGYNHNTGELVSYLSGSPHGPGYNNAGGLTMYELKQISKIYKHRQEQVFALRDISLKIEQGDFVAITGPSGSGKTTLLLTLGGLIHPSAGKITCKGTSVYELSPSQLSAYRNRTIGFVLQTFNLIPYLTAMENVMVPMLLQGNPRNGHKDRAKMLLSELGLEKRTDFLPRELSIGQQQRVALARALANNPDVILADEPTGNLDPNLALEILEILSRFCSQRGRTVIMVTHNLQAAEIANKKYILRAGSIV